MKNIEFSLTNLISWRRQYSGGHTNNRTQWIVADLWCNNKSLLLMHNFFCIIYDLGIDS